MNEFKYYDIPSPFPTLARGLFTRELESEGSKKYQIVVRGYDKFFNIGEVPWTSVRFHFSFALADRSHIFSQVGLPRGEYSSTIYSVPQIERMYHLYRSVDPYPTRRHLQALYGRCRSVSTIAEHEPRASW